MKKALLTALLCIAAHAAQAQYSDSAHYYLGYMSTGSINRTNTSSAYLLNNALKAGVKRKDISLNFNNAWVYGVQNRVLSNNDFTSSLDINLYKTFPHFFYWGLGNYTTSYSLKINNQYQGGLGIAYNIIHSKAATLNLSDGILFEGSDVTLTDSMRDRYHTFRNSLRIQGKCTIVKVIVVSGFGFYQASLTNSADYILKANLSLGVKLRKWLTLTTAFTYNKISRTDQENLLFTYGLTIERYF